MTTLELIDYYAKLLILQYVGLERASDTVAATVKPILMPQQSQQEITFSPAPTSGTFKLTYGALVTGSLNWNSPAGTIQTALRLLAGLSLVEVSGSIAAGLTIDFVGVLDVADLLEVTNSTLVSGIAVVVATVTETDQTLPIAVQNAFDPMSAVGVQLDVIGKYQGVTRYGNNFSGQPVTLTDLEFRTLIQFATIRNNAGSSLFEIQDLFNQIFPDQVFVFDYANMHMGYFVDSDLGSQNLVQLMINEGLLPKPMGVELAVTIYAPDLRFFGMSSAALIVAYAAQYGLTLSQAALLIQSTSNTWQFNSVAAPIMGQWLSASQGV